MAASQPVQFIRLAEVLNETLWLFRRNLASLFMIAAVAIVPVMLIGATIGDSTPAASTGSSSITSVQFWLDAARRLGSWRNAPFPILLVSLVLQPLASGALILAIPGCYAGRAIQARDSLAGASQRLLALIGAELLWGLLIVPTFIPSFICALILSARQTQRIFALEPHYSVAGVDAFSIVFGGLAVLGLALPLYVGLRLSFAPQALLLERLGPIQSITYSWGVTHRRFWRVLRVLGPVWLLSLALIRLPAVLVSELLLTAFGASVGTILATLIGAGQEIVTFSFGTCVATLVYFSLALNQPRPAPAPPNADDARLVLAAIEPPGASG